MSDAEGKPLLLALSVHTPPTMVISVVKSVKALSVVTARMVAETIVTATVVAVCFFLRLDQPRCWCAQLHRSGRRTVTDDMSCRWAETRPLVPGDSTIRLMADSPRYTTSNRQDAQRGQPRIRLAPVRRSMSTLLWKMSYKALLVNFTVTSACAT